MRSPDAVHETRAEVARGAYGDAELVRRAQLGSTAAFEELVVRHGQRVYRYLAVQLRHESDADDALQDTLTAAWRGLPSLRSAERFRPWLLGIASNKAADAARRRQTTTAAEGVSSSPDDSAMLELRDAVAGLPHHLREVVLLRYLVGLSEAEVAEALGVRLGTVKSRGARARRALMQVLR
jgi:RNA polymerase sigma-70 factor (ECF subfamily)